MPTITPETIDIILRQAQGRGYRQVPEYKSGTVFSLNSEYYVYVGVKIVGGEKHPIAVRVEGRRFIKMTKDSFNLIRQG